MAGRGRRRCGKRCSLKWNEHLLFRLEDNPAFGRQTQAPELKVLFEQTYPDELLRQLAPLFSGMLFTRAEDTQAVVSPGHHLLRPRTAQHGDNMSRPEALTGHLHTGKKHLRRGRGVGQVALHGLHAVVTVAAGLVVVVIFVCGVAAGNVAPVVMRFGPPVLVVPGFDAGFSKRLLPSLVEKVVSAVRAKGRTSADAARG
jgi:hypothetical protein